MAKALTEAQVKVLECVDKFIEVHNYPPTHREICADLGLSSVSSVAQQLRALERKGYLEMGNGKARAIVLTRDWR